MIAQKDKPDVVEDVEIGTFMIEHPLMVFHVKSFFSEIAVQVWNANTQEQSMKSLRMFFEGIKAGTIVLPDFDESEDDEPSSEAA